MSLCNVSSYFSLSLSTWALGEIREGDTGIPHFITLSLYCASQILHFFYKLKVGGNSALKSIGTIFPTDSDDA